MGNSVVDPATGAVTANPIYQGQPNHTQNAIYDENGNVKIYAVDGHIYNANGDIIVTEPYMNSVYPNPNHHGHSEYLFVPIPGECEKYYSFSVDRSLQNGTEIGYTRPILNFSVIDLALNNNAGGVLIGPDYTLPFNSFTNNGFTQEFINLHWQRDNEINKEAFHLGLTQPFANGHRFLFVSLPTEKLQVFEIGTGIGNIQEVFFKAPLTAMAMSDECHSHRTELEVWEDARGIKVICGVVWEDHLGEYGGFDHYYFEKSGNSIEINSQGTYELGDNVIPKGIEYSPNGEYLYFTAVWVLNRNSEWTGNNYVENPSIQVLNCNSQGFLSFMAHNIYLGPEDRDFSFGMIECDANGDLFVAGNNRIGRFNNANNPFTGLFDPDYVNVSNTLTSHDHDQMMEPDFVGNLIYLLPDQIDQENYSEWIIDNMPETLYVCDLPSLYVTQMNNVNWSYASSYSTKGEVAEWTNLGKGATVDFNVSGLYQINYTDIRTGCNKSEEFYVVIDPLVTHGADFQYSISYPAMYTKEIQVTPLSTACAHEWKVYQKDFQGVWQLLFTDYSSTPVFTGLDDPGQVKIEHIIYPNVVTNCTINLNSIIVIP